MPRVKKDKTNTPPPPPKDPRREDIGHGCVDCKHYPLDLKAIPCRDCERWNYWECVTKQITSTT